MATVPDAALAGQDHRQLLEPVTAVVDRGHLDQVLNNLLTNAVKYGGGRISVSTREVLDMVEVVVSDSGPGVPAEFVARLFDRFTRAEDARFGGRKGTGLGLYITRSLLTANAGTIEYRPTPGGGSSFRVQLPLLRTPSDPVIPPPDAGRAQGSTPLKHPV
jgi:signal transduction histidine kinase